MNKSFHNLPIRLLFILIIGTALLALACWVAISVGSSGSNFKETLEVFSGHIDPQSVTATIIRQIRLPRVALTAMVGAVLALGGLVFQALLRNPLAEPYILGVSGGSAVGAILAMLAGFPVFPGVTLAAFSGSMLTLLLVLLLASRRSSMNNDTLLLAGVMMNAFCGAIIMFLISISRSSEVHHILFWLMGDLSQFNNAQLPTLTVVFPVFLLIFLLARPMNLLLTGRDNAALMGVNVTVITLLLLAATTFMVSVAVCYSGLIGFVGLVIPHILRLLIGPDHRLLVPASILSGSAFLVICDLLARTLPAQGEMPVGIVTAMIGAPLFILLLWRSSR